MLLLDDRELLKAVYSAISWDKLYECAPGATREQVDELFRRVKESLGRQAARERPAEEAPASRKIEPGSLRSAILYCDGACSGNPGPAGIGVVLCAPDGAELEAWGEAIGKATNNVAEYKALLAGLARALELGICEIEIRCDSELLVRQITGAYKVKAAGLKELHAQALDLLERLGSWRARFVPRSENKSADKLATGAVRKARAKQNEQGPA